MDQRYSGYDFLSSRLYHRIVHTIKRESSDWGIMNQDCVSDWMLYRYQEVQQLRKSIGEERVKRMINGY